MHVFLLVLKIIGIVLLCVLLFVLLVLAALLFAPFRYEAKVDGRKDGPYVKAFGKVRWLFISGSYDFLLNGENELVIRLFGIPIKRIKKKPESRDGAKADGDAKKADEEKPKADDEKPKTDGDKPKADTADETAESTAATEQDAKTQQSVTEASDTGKADESEKPSEETDKEESEAGNTEASTDTETAENPEESGSETEEEPKKEKLFQRLKTKVGSVKSKISDKYHGIKNKISSLYDSCKAMLYLFGKKKGLLQEYLKKKSTKKAVRKAWDTLLQVLKHIAPKKYSGHVAFGLNDPALTGEIFAAISPFYAFVADHLTLTPVFENELVVDGNAFIKGRIRLWYILIRALRLYRDKNIRRVIHEAEKVKETLTNTPGEVKELFSDAA